eukprot:CAMPEP_0198141244 /NCGR_PEP_ID=MMETSP1443-20131203/4272_1 /TAXON_ID=186043 /ORGANISM="Entomoneis sp., Strain CCMP2396" /LENGTH=506 /DNA_ID=CAMNT_0043803919 /DNA_START=14 /DNA_END=1534 /DNA_ORIENTATION=+
MSMIRMLAAPLRRGVPSLRGPSSVGAVAVQRSYHASCITFREAVNLEEDAEPPAQPFVQTTIQSQEWDPINFQNPLYHPTFKARAKILSKEDFDRRPVVGFDETFESMADAMLVISHITHEEMEMIYQEYKKILNHGHEKYGVTSHEYVVRHIAQKYNIVAYRIAGIIQLQSNEEQYRKDGSREVLDQAGEYMDHVIKSEIADCYRAHSMKPPAGALYVEQPLARTAPSASKKFAFVDDVLDLDEIWRKYVEEHLPQKARKIISNHRYLEDKDDDKVTIKNDRETLNLIKKHEALVVEQKELFEKIGTPDVVTEYLENRPEMKKNRRPKFVAQMVNTRQLIKTKHLQKAKPNYTWFNEKKKKRSVTYSNNSPENTLVSEDGKLRPATLHDVKNVAWKPRRHEQGTENTIQESTGVMEVIYRDAKLKWLDQVNGRLVKTTTKKPAAGELEANQETENNLEEEDEQVEATAGDNNEEEGATTTAEASEEEAASTDGGDDDNKPPPSSP